MVTFECKYVSASIIHVSKIIEPDLEFNKAHGIKSDFSCDTCNHELGISWKQGPKDGMIVRCPTCKCLNEFIRREI